ncbi:MAG TPA: AAA family ATPase, partial [Cellvibrio sp.]|nr:AAA family ATPase [Cellvibrio sp.]
MSQFDQIVNRLEQLIDRVELLLPRVQPQPDWSGSAFRWRAQPGGQGYLQLVKNPHRVDLNSLKNVETQKQA